MSQDYAYGKWLWIVRNSNEKLGGCKNVNEKPIILLYEHIMRTCTLFANCSSKLSFLSVTYAYILWWWWLSWWWWCIDIWLLKFQQYFYINYYNVHRPDSSNSREPSQFIIHDMVLNCIFYICGCGNNGDTDVCRWYDAQYCTADLTIKTTHDESCSKCLRFRLYIQWPLITRGIKTLYGLLQEVMLFWKQIFLFTLLHIIPAYASEDYYSKTLMKQQILDIAKP